MTSTTTPGMIKVWVKINGNEPEKVEIRDDSDIDDLKNELFIRNKEEKRQYYSIFNNERLSSSTHVPNSATCERPILFFKMDENYRENDSDDMDTARVTATNLNTVPPNQHVLNTTFTISTAENENEIDLLSTASTVTTSMINTTVAHIPLHLVDTIHYKNGDKYVGEINEKREPNGKGTMCWKNGRRYEGQWKNGKKDGQGIEYGANGAVNYTGEWRDDVRVSSYNEDDQ